MLLHFTSKSIFLCAMAFVVVVAAALSAATKPNITKRANSSYATPNAVSFVRPGLTLKVLSASVAADGTIKAQFSVTDPMGLPLDMDGIATPGSISVQFVAASIPKAQQQYVAYTTRFWGPPDTKLSGNLPHADTGGSFRKVADGQYEYTFATKAPIGFDPSATHSIGAYAWRDLTAFNLGTNNSSDAYTFVPNGSAVTVVRDVIRSASCNQCHTTVSYHDGKRQGMALCVLCHTPQNQDLNTGETLDLRSLIHKIHAGTDIDSVQAGGTWVISTNDFTSSQDFSVFEPVAVTKDCQFCHQSGPAQADNWKTNPGRTACGSCHDTTNFATGENHVNQPQIDDKLCASCHIPDSGQALDASIVGAHTIPAYSSTLPGVVFELIRVDNAGPGKRPTVVFSVKDKAGSPIQPASMGRLSLVISGPTTDYAGWVQEDARQAPVASDGTVSYTFLAPLVASAAGTYTVGIEGYRLIPFLPGTTKETVAPDVGDNKMLNFSVDGSNPQPRRTIVSTAKCANCHQPQPLCNSCHNDSLHNGDRNQFDYCVLCHNPNETDQAQRPADQMPAESVNFGGLIHKIHNGVNRNWRSVYGIGGIEDSYPSVTFPGDLGKCDNCHVNGSEQLPLPAGLLPVKNPAGPITSMGRASESCLGCHDTDPAAISHVMANTSKLGESCAVCHGPDDDFAVSKVHAH
jgi:OmcA/MtrC family decaheme c-type cytochrome